MAAFIEDRTFGKAEVEAQQLAKAAYENCTFQDIDFTNHDLSEFKFIDCIFIRCNISTVKLVHTSFQTVSFVECKMLGLHFDTCNSFGFAVSYKQCVLNHCIFYNVKLKKTKFHQCSLREVDFSNADLTEAVLEECDLMGAIFEQTNLEKADFRTAQNYLLDPNNNRVKGAKFSLDGVRGLLEQYAIVID